MVTLHFIYNKLYINKITRQNTYAQYEHFYKSIFGEGWVFPNNTNVSPFGETLQLNKSKPLTYQSIYLPIYLGTVGSCSLHQVIR